MSRKSLFLLHTCELTEATENSSISFCWHQFQADTDNNSSRSFIEMKQLLPAVELYSKTFSFPVSRKLLKMSSRISVRSTSAVLFMPVCRKLGNFWLIVIYTNFKQTLKTIHTGPFYQYSNSLHLHLRFHRELQIVKYFCERLTSAVLFMDNLPVANCPFFTISRSMKQ